MNEEVITGERNNERLITSCITTTHITCILTAITSLNEWEQSSRGRLSYRSLLYRATHPHACTHVYMVWRKLLKADISLVVITRLVYEQQWGIIGSLAFAWLHFFIVLSQGRKWPRYKAGSPKMPLTVLTALTMPECRKMTHREQIHKYSP